MSDDPLVEYHRTSGQERLRSGVDVSNLWASTIIKTLVALNSGGLITLAALFTDSDREIARSVVGWPMLFLLVGVIFAIGGGFCGLFNGLALQQSGWNRLEASVSGKVKSDLESNESRIDWTLRIGIILGLMSLVGFVIGTCWAFIVL